MHARSSRSRLTRRQTHRSSRRSTVWSTSTSSEIQSRPQPHWLHPLIAPRRPSLPPSIRTPRSTRSLPPPRLPLQQHFRRPSPWHLLRQRKLLLLLRLRHPLRPLHPLRHLNQPPPPPLNLHQPQPQHRHLPRHPRRHPRRPRHPRQPQHPRRPQHQPRHQPRHPPLRHPRAREVDADSPKWQRSARGIVRRHD